jgi:glycosyltransferase involved in cell wall biosynthesis
MVTDDHQMTLRFSTLFDSRYATRGLTMLESLEKFRHPDDEVYVLALDDQTRRMLDRMSHRWRVLSVADLDDPELSALEKIRPHREFCWTCASALAACLVRTAGESDLSIYIDSDLYFFGNPRELLKELDGGSILIHEHRYSQDKIGSLNTSGRFNVGFVVFRTGDEARACVRRWRQQTIDLCVDDPDRGLCGDQGYLNEWPQLYPNLKILQHLGGGVAPWNVNQYVIGWDHGHPTVNGTPVIFYHYHQLRTLYVKPFGLVGVLPAVGYEFPLPVQNAFYQPYLKRLRHATSAAMRAGLQIKHDVTRSELRRGFVNVQYVLPINRLKFFKMKKKNPLAKSSTATVSSIAIVRKAQKLVTGVKALYDLRAHYESFHQVVGEIQQLAATVDEIKRAMQDVPSRLDLEEFCHRVKPSIVRPRIVIDGILYQYSKTGIVRVWSCLLEEWSRTKFADHLVVLDRAGTTPRIKGIHYRTIKAHNYRATASDSLYLEKVCRKVGADLFVSTYYSSPIETRSVFMGYDMIPELMGLTHNDERFREKRRAIEHASAHIMISQNSANDLERIFPTVAKNSTLVAHCGVAAAFGPAGAPEIEAFKARYNLARPYILHVGNRQSYKNGILLFRAMSLLPDPKQFTLVCVGGSDMIEPQFREFVSDIEVHRLELSDDELRAAYSGAHAYVCPSRYEGFGLPILEAMACACPVVACLNSSIPEVAGQAALFVGEDDPAGLAEVLLRIEAPELRGEYVRRGSSQAAGFSFQVMSERIAKNLLDTNKMLANGTQEPGRNAWRELRTLQRKGEELTAQALKPSTDAVSEIALVRKAQKLVTGVKALYALGAYYESFHHLVGEIRQLTASVDEIKYDVQDIPKRARVGGSSKDG